MASSCSHPHRVGASSEGGGGHALSTSHLKSRPKSEGPEDDPLPWESGTFTAEWDQRGGVMRGDEQSLSASRPSHH